MSKETNIDAIAAVLGRIAMDSDRSYSFGSEWRSTFDTLLATASKAEILHKLGMLATAMEGERDQARHEVSVNASKLYALRRAIENTGTTIYYDGDSYTINLPTEVTATAD